jgi:hypothetical protein
VGGMYESGGYVRDSAVESMSKLHAHMISFGLLFISIPVIPLKFTIDPSSTTNHIIFKRHPRVGILAKGYVAKEI